MPSLPTSDRFRIQAVGFHTRLSPYLSQLYKSILASTEKKLHPDAEQLADALLGFLPFSPDEVLGFLTKQVGPLLEATDSTCHAMSPLTEGERLKIPSLRLMICDRKYIKLNSNSMFYDVENNTLTDDPKYFPLTTTSFAMVPVYAQIRKAVRAPAPVQPPEQVQPASPAPAPPG